MGYQKTINVDGGYSASYCSIRTVFTDVLSASGQFTLSFYQSKDAKAGGAGPVLGKDFGVNFDSSNNPFTVAAYQAKIALGLTNQILLAIAYDFINSLIASNKIMRAQLDENGVQMVDGDNNPLPDVLVGYKIPQLAILDGATVLP